ncbi:hypothetical protein ABN034_16680 [Actinopolymorpha sp. B11F2]|uniref:hypothetical protein n=1 Tax=Actinopolymorpha sp. B11F2 TaxID=3160862 RepID=UPI0032E4F6AE
MPVTSGPDGPCSPHPALVSLLTGAVWRLRCRTRRRIFTSSAEVHLLARDGAPAGDPSGDLLAGAVHAPLDHALRVDLAVRTLESLVSPGDAAGEPVTGGAPSPVRATMIVVRPGPLEFLEHDRDWWRSWLVACDIVGVEPAPIYAATRLGWLDVTGTEPVVVPRVRRTVGSR